MGLYMYNEVESFVLSGLRQLIKDGKNPAFRGRLGDVKARYVARKAGQTYSYFRDEIEDKGFWFRASLCREALRDKALALIASDPQVSRKELTPAYEERCESIAGLRHVNLSINFLDPDWSKKLGLESDESLTSMVSALQHLGVSS